MLRLIPVALFVLCLIACAGCFPLPDRNLQRHATEVDIIGTWKLTPDSLVLLQRDGFVSDPSHQYTIEFREDGTLSFKSVVTDFTSGTYHEVEGEWELLHDITDGMNFTKMNELKISMPVKDHLMFSAMNLDEDNGNLILWEFYGDPDSWEFMEYEPK